MKRYRIMNRITGQWWEGYAQSAAEACEKAGWLMGYCWIRLYSAKGSGGWKIPPELKGLINHEC